MNADRFKFRVAIKQQDGSFRRYGVASITYMTNSIDVLYMYGEKILRICQVVIDGVNAILEQCTGLKDKNGKLIYEGDVLGGSNGSINGIEWPYKTTVTWDAGQHRFVMPNWAWNDNGEYEGGRTHYVEIIGNIHESEAKSE